MLFVNSHNQDIWLSTYYVLSSSGNYKLQNFTENLAEMTKQSVLAKEVLSLVPDTGQHELK